MVRLLEAAVSHQTRASAEPWTDSSVGGDGQQSVADTGDKLVSKWRLPQDCSLQPLLLSKCWIFLDSKDWQERGVESIPKVFVKLS